MKKFVFRPGTSRRMRTRLNPLGIGALLVLGFLPLPPPAWPADGGPVWRIFDLINDLRAREGLELLRWDEQLDTVAQVHAEDMAANDFFDHKNPDGTDIDARMAAAGYTYKVVAENIAAGTADPEKAVRSWLESEPHKNTLLLPPARDAGIGYAYLADDPGGVRYKHYWVLVVALRKK